MSTSINRREVIAFSSAALLTPASVLAAAPAKPAANAPVDAKALVDSGSRCIAAAEECMEHCITMLSNGDKSMAECFAAVRAMKPVTEGLVALAKLNSSHLRAYAQLCAKVCRDCEKACKPHADMHATCKACMDSCAKCASACEKA